jgi:predicted nucleic acid-binding protein
MKILIDTSVVIDFQRVKEKQNTWLYKLAISGQDLCISILTHTELHAGSSIWEDKRKKKELEIVLKDLRILPLTPEISEMSGKIKYLSGIKTTDAIIAATAIANKISLATLDRKDFPKVKGLELIKTPK